MVNIFDWERVEKKIHFWKRRCYSNVFTMEGAVVRTSSAHAPASNARGSAGKSIDTGCVVDKMVGGNNTKGFNLMLTTGGVDGDVE